MPMADVREHFLNFSPATSGMGVARTSGVAQQISHFEKQMQLDRLINAYRSHGHHHAKLDPLELHERKEIPDLQLGHYGFTHADLDTAFVTHSLVGAHNKTLREIQNALIRTYADTVGVEYMHIADQEQTEWLTQRLEAVQSHPHFSPEAKRHILQVNLLKPTA